MDGDRIVDKAADISNLLVSHFRQRFNMSSSINGYFDDLSLPSISVEQASILEQRFTMEELRAAV